jgi:hemolysin III
MNGLRATFKDPVSGLTHLASAVAALAGGVVLVLVGPSSALARLALLAYSLSLVLLFAASSTYHLVKTSPARERMLRKFDHTAIFLLIAGTYTPVCAIVLNGAWRWALLSAIWALAAVGIAFKLLYIQAPRWASVAIYVAMGWVGVVCFQPLFQALPWPAFAWLLAGGVLYTVGATIYGTQRPNFFPGTFGFHEVWHLFVTAAGAAHYIFVLFYVVPVGLR